MSTDFVEDFSVQGEAKFWFANLNARAQRDLTPVISQTAGYFLCLAL